MKRNYYICTAIPYVNDKPHVGHAMDLLYGDATARYVRKSPDVDHVSFSAGTDEHGTKIAEKAQKEGKTPKEFVDESVENWKNFFTRLNISNDRFVRTTDKAHEDRVAIIWNNLSKDIYLGKYTGWYCVGCEEYKTETHAKDTKGVCPEHNRAYERFEEENYFFKLSNYAEKILKAIEDGEMKIYPERRKNEMINILRDGLEDISVSRPRAKLEWGVPVPGDKNQVMYVWFDALLNYITTIGYPEHKDFKDFWPADLQVVGKDILRFHAIFWPAILLGLGLPLPRHILAHGFVTSSGQKMSKSIGNVIDPVELMDEYGTDAFRYFFFKHISSTEDGDYTPERFKQAYNNELANDLGNAVSRVSSMIQKYQEGLIGDIPDSQHDQARYHEAMEEFRFDKALEVVWEQVRSLNQYIDETKPWAIAKVNDADHLREVLAYCSSCLLEIADLLDPFLPETAEKINKVFAKGVIPKLEGTLFPKKDI